MFATHKRSLQVPRRPQSAPVASTHAATSTRRRAPVSAKGARHNRIRGADDDEEEEEANEVEDEDEDDGNNEDEEGDEDEDNYYDDDSEEGSVSGDEEGDTGPSSSSGNGSRKRPATTDSANAQLSMSERLKALSRENEDDSFASVNSAWKRAKLDKRGQTHSSKRGANSANDDDDDGENDDGEDNRQRRSKHGPAIMRSDRPVKRLRDNVAVDTSKKKFRDPRFV
jgi:hypothetical protein